MTPVSFGNAGFCLWLHKRIAVRGTEPVTDQTPESYHEAVGWRVDYTPYIISRDWITIENLDVVSRTEKCGYGTGP